MKRHVPLGAILLAMVVWGVAAAQQSTTNSPANDKFLGLLHPGQRVVLADTNGGYYLAIGQNVPAWVTVGTGNQTVRQTEAGRRLLETEYQQAVAANQRVPNTVPEQQMQLLRAQLTLQTRTVEQARQLAARPEVWEVSVVGDDYLGLRSEGIEMRIPLLSIRAIVQQTAPAAAKPAASQ